MSTKLGTLTLDLVAKIGNFTGPIKDAEKQTKLSFDNMRNHVNNYGAVAVAGAAAVGAGVFAMANEYANAARELQIFASISNTTTQEFQRMAVGAQTMGISQEQLADQLKDFNEKLGEFITIGSGGAVDFFEQIAIKTEGSAEGARKLALEMQNLPGPKALQLYVDKLEEAGATQQQMSFYLESMASDTTNLIPLLRDGGKGFEYWADAAERAGVIMDESAIAKANELKVQMELLGLQVDGAKNKFIQGLMPALVSVGDGMSNAATETNLMSDAGETLGEVFKGVAATGMGVYAVVKMLSNAIAGLAFDAVNAKKTVDLAAEKGTWADKLPGVKFAKTAIFGVTMAKAPNSGVAMAAKDNAKVADDVASSIGRIYSNAVNQSVSAMAKIQGSQAGVTKGSDEWIKKQNEASKSAAKNSKANSDAAKALREYNRSVELGKRLIYEYGDEQLRIAEDLRKDLDEIQSASLKPEAKDRYAAVARMQADARKKAYIAELDSELNEHKATEEEKLKTELNINKLRLDGQRGLNENELKLRKQALDEQYEYQRKQLSINQAKELLETKKLWISAGEYAQEYYALVREEILNTPSYSPEMKDAKIKQANLQQGMEQNAEREQVWGDYQDRFTQTDYYQQDVDLLKSARKQMLITDQEYYQKRSLLHAEWGENYFSGTADVLKSVLGEESGYYQAAFAISQGYAAAKVALNAPETYSNVYNAVSGIPYVGPYIAPVMAGAAVALQLAQAATVGSVSFNPSGYADGGFTGHGGKYEPAGIVHKGEGVLTQEEIAALGGPAGFYALRDSIRNGFSDGGLVMDAPKVLNPSKNPEVKRAMDQVQSNSGQPQVNLNPNFVIVDEREKLGDYLFGPDGKKAMVKFFKQNRKELGIA